MSAKELYLARDGKTGNDFDTDGNGHLVYWDPVEKIHPLLEPAQPITDPHAVIGKIGQQNMLPGHLVFKRADFTQTQVADEDGNVVGTPVPPGLSGFLFFNGHASRDAMGDFSSSQMAKELHKKNRVHIAQVGDIWEAGWTVYYAPLIDRRYPIYNPLHVIISPNSLQRAGQRVDPTPQEREALAKIFVRW